MVALFLCTLVSLILLKTVKNDFSRYAQWDLQMECALGFPPSEEEDKLSSSRRTYSGKSDDSGWKQIHGDVWRKPKGLLLFTTLYGAGVHVAAGTNLQTQKNSV